MIKEEDVARDVSRVGLFIFLISLGLLYIGLFTFLCLKSEDFTTMPRVNAAKLWAESKSIAIPTVLSFDEKSPWTMSLAKGWNAPESAGVWSNSAKAILFLPSPRENSSGNVCFHFWITAMTNDPSEDWPFQIFINDHVAMPRTHYVGSGPYEISASSYLPDRKMIGIILEGPKPRSPRSIGAGNDVRQLSFILHSIRITKACDGDLPAG